MPYGLHGRSGCESHCIFSGYTLVGQNVWPDALPGAPGQGTAWAGAVEVFAIRVSAALHLLLTPGGGSGGWAATMPVSSNAAMGVNCITANITGLDNVAGLAMLRLGSDVVLEKGGIVFAKCPEESTDGWLLSRRQDVRV